MNTRRLSRALVLGVFGSRPVTRFMIRHGMRCGAARFVAGEHEADAFAVAGRLVQSGARVSLTYLGEYVKDAGAARQAADTYVRLLEASRDRDVPVGLSVKLTQLGLDVDRGVCLGNARLILAAAAQGGAPVEIDMEDSQHVDAILDCFSELHGEFPELGICLQSYLRRTPRDAAALVARRARVRLVKGAYVEPPDVAYTRRSDIDRQYLELAEQLLDGGCFLAVATHDARLIEGVRGMIARRGLDEGRYEVQMLRGIHTALQARLLARGVPLRVLVVYGREWYPWFVRRLAERPANVGLLLRNFLLPSGLRDRPGA